jgi:hypothetical protein
VKAEPSLGLSTKKGDPSVQRKYGETEPQSHLAEQVAAANAHGRHASCCAGDRARRERG